MVKIVNFDGFPGIVARVNGTFLRNKNRAFVFEENRAFIKLTKTCVIYQQDLKLTTGLKVNRTLANRTLSQNTTRFFEFFHLLKKLCDLPAHALVKYKF